jgi:F0F1-type ATP synthase membrane subunit c/vacuolar-type H+-ATPase subunit K
MIFESAKLLVAGLATISITVTVIVVVIIFAALIGAYSRTPEHVKQLFLYAVLGFALS